MDLLSLKNEINTNNYKKVGSLQLRFIKKRDRQNYTSYMPKINEKVRFSLAQSMFAVLDKEYFNKEQVQYNELGKDEDTLEVTNLNTANITNIIDTITSQSNTVLDLSEMKLDEINFYVIEISINENKVFLFRKFNKQKKLRKGVRGHIVGNKFVKLDEEVIGIDDEIDIIVFLDEALIVNRFALQTIFDLTDYFQFQGNLAMEKIRDYEVIENFDSFKKDCLNDGAAIKRLTRIINTPNLIEGFIENFKNLKTVIDQASLNIKLDENENIVYQGSYKERTQILSCIADKYYITLLQGVIGEDKLK